MYRVIQQKLIAAILRTKYDIENKLWVCVQERKA